MTNEELWRAILAEIELSISRANFITWFKNTSLILHDHERAVVAVPNAFAKEWIENKYNKFIIKFLRANDSSIKHIEYVVQGPPRRSAEFTQPVQKLVPVLTISDTDPSFREIAINRETNLNPKYTFENFVIGSFNELAHAAAQAVAKNPGTSYNPLFIYGGVGVGKTHLLQAIGNLLAKSERGLVVRYAPSEKFTDEVVNSIRNRTIEELKGSYRAVDVLLVDDVQFVAGKDKTQEELFHIFNALHQKNKQVVFTSDRPPKAIPAIEERLRSRFEGGMIADVGIPDYETRLAILKTKLLERGGFLQDQALEFIASHIQKNVRELEGALNRVLEYAKVRGTYASPQELEQVLKSLIVPPKKILTAKKIFETVAEFYDLQSKELLGLKRQKEIVRPRQVAMYLIREELQSSYPYIGEMFGGKDHTTVIHACEKISREAGVNETLNEELNMIKQRLYATA